MTRVRRRIVVRGIVQGVGFRPFVYSQAHRYQLAGFVRNDSTGVTIEIEGTPPSLDSFEHALHHNPPPLARIDTVHTTDIPLHHEKKFIITQSHAATERRTLISPDTTTCEACLTEIRNPTDRRFQYPFTNCTNCGPRFTIVQDVPYDREKTTMRVFPMCTACQSEYDNPLDRRFHAQPNACADCGPTLSLEMWETTNEEPSFNNTIQHTATLLTNGAILAIKGLGGYHLVCDALHSEAVRTLRQRKHREAKPFALMVPDLATARQLCTINATEADLLQSHRRPIVLLDQRPNIPIASDIAPNYTTLGIMLPYTPLHHLLLDAFAQVLPPDRPAVLVMTSGNLSDEPIAYQDDDARARLSSIADGILLHNRAIHMRCDDSVTRAVVGEQMVRRSRGYVPEPISLATPFPLPVLACGGHLKNTFCLGKENHAFVSHHIGDLENLETLTSFREGIEHFQRLFDITPQAIAYDLHPEYLATKYALDTNIPHKIGIQHHHAHIASVLAENKLEGPIIGVAADGTGYGTDNAIWGFEILCADLQDFERHAHLEYVPLPGGEQAVRQPWRMAAVHLSKAFGEDFLNLPIPFVQSIDQQRWNTLKQMIDRNINSPPTSSLGRLFDAVAALLGIRNEVLYEGQAAIELEALAEPSQNAYPFTVIDGTPAQIDVVPMFHAIVADLQQHKPLPQIVGRFHATISTIIVTQCEHVRQQTSINDVALSGGVFQNRLLLQQSVAQLEENTFRVYLNHLVPPNDGGISLGQAAIAAARLKSTITN
ncbi:MAG: carbamoyltransferase HypF [Chloroflexota bacterium]